MKNRKKLIEQAKRLQSQVEAQKREPYYYKTIAWFHYLGLLRHNKIMPHRYRVTLTDALKAGELEPRVLELIPAILVVLPKALKFKKNEIPDDLAEQVALIRARGENGDFRGIPPRDYLHWVRAPIMNIAKRRIDYRRLPRRRGKQTHMIGEFIRDSRLRLSLTQKELAEKHNLSLRVIRDLEQGKLDASLKSTNEILQAFDRSLRI